MELPETLLRQYLPPWGVMSKNYIATLTVIFQTTILRLRTNFHNGKLIFGKILQREIFRGNDFLQYSSPFDAVFDSRFVSELDQIYVVFLLFSFFIYAYFIV